MDELERELVARVRARHGIPASVSDEEINEQNKRTLEYAMLRFNEAALRFRQEMRRLLGLAR